MKTGGFTEAVAAQHPERFRRVREHCVWADEGFDLDEHAARIVHDVEKAILTNRFGEQTKTPAPHGLAATGTGS